MTQEEVLREIAAERARQDAKWGDQSHSYDGTGPDEHPLGNWRTASGLAFTAQRTTDEAMRSTEGATMAQILLEEVFEALAEDEPVALRHELVQVAAVAVAWIEYVDRRGARPLPGRRPEPEGLRCTCPSGDGSLRWPCPSHPPTDPEAEGSES